MKTRNRHYLVLSFFVGMVISILLPPTVMAQAPVAINVSAKVLSSIEMMTLKSMQLSGAEAKNNIITIDPVNSSLAGKMVAYGTPNSDIRISFLSSRELTNTQNNGTLTFNYQVAGNQQEDQSSSEILSRENRDFSFNNNGKFYLWIGGSVDISTAVPGNYQGEFTLDIEYI